MPNFYQNPYQYSQYNYQPQQMQIPQQTAQMPQQTTQIQSGGFVTVRSEDEARNYPVAPGNSITFFNETQPYCYKKTMSFSPLDHPTFERYKIVKEENSELPQVDPKTPQPIENINDEIEAIKRDIEDIKEKMKINTSRSSKGVKKDDAESE